ncbi:hypothetical protein PAHAL_7G303900 [Panicum hallii]|uniref:Uncharacterized protein n=1 Tax=Panicum hallii TaxID=206008 RepID=A0A2T8IE02_9POAL|nr:hypothetical protein PAHAL_7G303900 [Panicum hallii]PVH35909.1 hypothetical protein PAHAL_7G303900 [Panicum hallii]PVH35910.1 hypothetical protein PAHAL_7G303900 [Panicum hallii]PVH35911.1 hypothetical protein PAHAL_7G303900 [Panicum hallii]
MPATTPGGGEVTRHTCWLLPMLRGAAQLAGMLLAACIYAVAPFLPCSRPAASIGSFPSLQFALRWSIESKTWAPHPHCRGTSRLLDGRDAPSSRRGSRERTVGEGGLVLGPSERAPPRRRP